MQSRTKTDNAVTLGTSSGISRLSSDAEGNGGETGNYDVISTITNTKNFRSVTAQTELNAVQIFSNKKGIDRIA